MVSFNSVVIAGDLTRDPELRYTSNGKAICHLHLAVSRFWKDKCGARHEDVCFIDVIAENRTAEVAAQFLKKGRSVLIHGRLEFVESLDRKSGEKHGKHRVVAAALKFLGKTNEQVPAVHSDEEGDDAEG